MSKDYVTLHEKWAADVEACERGAKVPTSYPQCESCAHFIKGNAMHCRKYVEVKKPREVIFAMKECPEFTSAHPFEPGTLSERENRLLGGIFGFCIGDMLGVPVEFTERSLRDHDPVRELRAYGTYHQPFGTWSDDSSLMLCLMDAICSDNLMDRLRENMVGYYRKGLFTPGGVMFDIGIATAQAISRIEAGVPSDRCGGNTEWDNGNGALMRILPLAFLSSGLEPAELCDLVKRVSSLTHGHARSNLACIFYTVLAERLYSGLSRTEAYESAISFVKIHCRETYGRELCIYESILSGDIARKPREAIRARGFVVATLEAALWAFLRSSSYEEAVLLAVNLGGDTDTIAAITGGLCGVYYGFNSIPDRLVQNVRKKEMISDLALQMYVSIASGRLGTERE